MADAVLPNGARLAWDTRSYEAAFLAEMGRRVRLAAEVVKAYAQRNLSTSSRAAGPSKPGEFPHADTGRLRQSVFVQADGLEAIVGTDLPVGLCVFGHSTLVATDKGSKQISHVTVGDMVLTQTGEFRPVIAVQRRSALEMPNLVEFAAPWHGDKEHVLTLTEDHKVLVRRDGLNKWVPAGELTEEDEVFVRRKKAHNEGIREASTDLRCRNCDNVFTAYVSRSSAIFCSVACRAAYWSRTDTNPHTGLKRTEESKAKMSEAWHRRMLANPESHPNRIMGKKGFRTKAELDVEEWLLCRGLDYEPQKLIGGMFADFFVPKEITAYEADGAFWHQDQAEDIFRDVKMLHAFPGLQILHLHFYDKRFSPSPLDQNPLPGVHYVKCNPGTASFASPATFEARKISYVKKRNYAEEYAEQRRKCPRAAAATNVHCLTVEGVHSFVASGIVVHNCLEYGTAGGVIVRAKAGKALSWVGADGKRRFARWVRLGRIEPRPWLRRSLDECRPRIRAIIEKPWDGGSPSGALAVEYRGAA